MRKINPIKIKKGDYILYRDWWGDKYTDFYFKVDKIIMVKNTYGEEFHTYHLGSKECIYQFEIKSGNRNQGITSFSKKELTNSKSIFMKITKKEYDAARLACII